MSKEATLTIPDCVPDIFSGNKFIRIKYAIRLSVSELRWPIIIFLEVKDFFQLISPRNSKGHFGKNNNTV